MSAVIITPADLAPFADIDPAKAQAMIDDALALAARVAPCINDATFEYDDAAKAIIRGAILRWNDAGTGAVTQQSWGPYAQMVDTSKARRSMFWPSEITDLAGLCSDSANAGRAFEISTEPTDAGTGYTWTGPDTWVPL